MVVYALSPDSARIGAGSLLHVQAMKSIGEDLYVNEWTETLQGAWEAHLLVIDRLLRRVQLQSEPQLVEMGRNSMNSTKRSK